MFIKAQVSTEDYRSHIYSQSFTKVASLETYPALSEIQLEETHWPEKNLRTPPPDTFRRNTQQWKLHSYVENTGEASL